MREECKHFESRTYASGEVVRKCNLNLAPEAPWRCPAECPSYARRFADVNWSYGSLITPRAPDEPPGLDRGAAQLLDEAEAIVNAAGPEILADLSELQQRAMGRRSLWDRLRRRR